MTQPQSTQRILLWVDGASTGRALLGELLARTSAELVLATSREALLGSLRAGLAPELAARVSPYRLDLRDGRGVQTAIDRVGLAVVASGPFRPAPVQLARAALCSGVDYVDLSSHRETTLSTLELQRELHPGGGGPLVAPAFGLTALAGALLTLAARDLDRVERARVALVPGAGFPAGLVERAQAVAHASRPVRALRGGDWTTLPGWSEPLAFDFPAPLGSRSGRLVDAADCALLFGAVGARAFELRLDERALSGPGLAGLARLRGAGVPFGSRGLAGGLALLGAAGEPAPAGAVGVELEGSFGRHRLRVRATALSHRGLARLAVLPAAHLAVRLTAPGGPETRDDPEPRDDEEARPEGAIGHAAWVAPAGLAAACARAGVELALRREQPER